MAGEFKVDGVPELFDDVTLAKDGSVVNTKPLTLTMQNRVFSKWIVVKVRGESGSYPTAIKLDLPNGKSSIQPGGNVNIGADGAAIIRNKVSLIQPIKGTYRFNIFLGDQNLCHVEVEL